MASASSNGDWRSSGRPCSLRAGDAIAANDVPKKIGRHWDNGALGTDDEAVSARTFAKHLHRGVHTAKDSLHLYLRCRCTSERHGRD